MAELDMKKAIKSYNDIMFHISREHNTIGTSYSEETENWNLRDMVSEMAYTLEMYESTSCIYWEEAHDPYQPRRSDGRGKFYVEWINDKARMKRFIKKYESFIDGIECATGHCSNYD